MHKGEYKGGYEYFELTLSLLNSPPLLVAPSMYSDRPNAVGAADEVGV